MGEKLQNIFQKKTVQNSTAPRGVVGMFKRSAPKVTNAARETGDSLLNKLRTVAKKNNGYLPRSRHVTEKEIAEARALLPATGAVIANSQSQTVVLKRGISKGKSVKFTLKARRDFTSNRNGVSMHEWTTGNPVEHPKYNPALLR